jgi:hypothetical protein
MSRSGDRVSSVLLRLALAVSVVVALAFIGPGVADSGGFAVLLLGVPVAASAVAVLAERFRYGAVVTWVMAVVQVVWALLLGLGVGLALLPAALVETAAATRQSLSGRTPDAGEPPVQRSRA